MSTPEDKLIAAASAVVANMTLEVTTNI